jgi:hypothetical protein
MAAHGENNSKQSVKLPQINIPEFTGKIEEWIEFFDIFKSLIDENKSIAPIEKFFYLKSSLRGEALCIIFSLEISAANYNYVYNNTANMHFVSQTSSYWSERSIS